MVRQEDILPSPEIYEQEFTYWPWGDLVRQVIDTVVAEAPHNGSVLDLLCGPGYLLGRVRERRPDLSLHGVDINERYIEHARTLYPAVEFTHADARTFNVQPADVVVCTAGVHHLPYTDQPAFITKLASATKPDGLCVVGDPYVRAYHSESERRRAATELGIASLRAVIVRGAPVDVIQTAVDVMRNDIEGLEFKISIPHMDSLVRDAFGDVAFHPVWLPESTALYGDAFFTLRRPYDEVKR